MSGSLSLTNIQVIRTYDEEPCVASGTSSAATLSNNAMWRKELDIKGLRTMGHSAGEVEQGKSIL